MPLIISIIVASVVWVITWAIGLKGFDGFMLALLIVLATATVLLLGKGVSDGDDAVAAETD